MLITIVSHVGSLGSSSSVSVTSAAVWCCSVKTGSGACDDCESECCACVYGNVAEHALTVSSSSSAVESLGSGSSRSYVVGTVSAGLWAVYVPGSIWLVGILLGCPAGMSGIRSATSGSLGRSAVCGVGPVRCLRVSKVLVMVGCGCCD